MQLQQLPIFRTFDIIKFSIDFLIDKLRLMGYEYDFNRDYLVLV
jgi:hypothetical protein